MNEYHSFTQGVRAGCHENIHTYLLHDDDADDADAEFSITRIHCSRGLACYYAVRSSCMFIGIGFS